MNVTKEGIEQARIIYLDPKVKPDTRAQAKKILEDAGEAVPDPNVARWNLMTTEQLFAPLPEYPWLMRGLHLAPGRVTLLAGYANSGKTIVAQSVAISIATGWALWGQHEPTRVGRVLHLNGEVSSFIARERYQRLVNGAHLSMEDVVAGGRLVLANYPRVSLDEKDFEAELAKQVRGFDLVIVDSLRAFSGALDENAKEIGVALFTLARVSELTGATFLVLHHTKKKTNGHEPTNMAEMISGSSSIFGGSECAFVLAGEKGEPVTVHHERSPIGRTMPDFGLRFTDVSRYGNHRWGLRLELLDADDLDDAREEVHSKRIEVKQKQSTKTTAKRIAEVIYAQPNHEFSGSVDKLRKMVGGNTDTFYAVWKQCIQTGAVVRSEGRANPVFRIGTLEPEDDA